MYCFNSHGTCYVLTLVLHQAYFFKITHSFYCRFIFKMVLSCPFFSFFLSIWSLHCQHHLLFSAHITTTIINFVIHEVYFRPTLSIYVYFSKLSQFALLPFLSRYKNITLTLSLLFHITAPILAFFCNSSNIFFIHHTFSLK